MRLSKTHKSLILILVIVVAVLGYVIYSDKKQDKSDEEIKYYLTLKGDKQIEMYEGDKYVEPGYVAKDSNNNNLYKDVVVSGNLDSNKEGTYIISYKLKDKELTRTIKVLRDPLKDITFELNGNKVINIVVNEKFDDPLFKCISNVDNTDLKEYVKIDSNLDIKKIGTYKITYELKFKSKKKSLTRVVNVLKKKYEYKLSQEGITNQDIIISFNSYIPNFSYIIDPNNSKIDKNKASFTVSTNGQYKFLVYDTDNNYEEVVVPVNNIDKVSPVITSCQGIIKNNKTTYTIASSDNDISKIYLNGNIVNLSSNSFSVNGAFENATIQVYDVVGNKSDANCSAYYDYNRPSNVENVIFNVETSTLKVLIDERTRNSRTKYYVTHVWVRNPYYQFKSNVPDKYGEELLNASTLLTNAVNRNNLNNKLVVAVNGSGFVRQSNGWNTYLLNYDSKYEKTSVTPLVLVEGTIKRDFSGMNVKSNHYTYGLKRDGWFGYYSSGTNSSVIINDGVLNTFGFNPVLVDNGDIKVTADAKNIRQGLCQIDKNNFVFISDVYDQGRTGFSYLEMAKYMVSLGCKIGFNLDGGGSVSLIAKPANSAQKVITGNTRDIADIVYFHE